MDGKIFVVYKHTNIINGKVYIGITSQDPPEKRWGADGCNYASSTHFANAIQKYGWENFSHEILHEGLTCEEACDKEIYYINLYNSMNRECGYNSTSGGKYFIMSEESRAKKSKAMIGNKNGLGKPCTPEKAKKISDAQKGKTLSEKHKENISKAKRGRSHKTISDSGKANISNSKYHTGIKKKVYCVETDTVYESVHACARTLNLDATNVSATCRGKHKHVKGYHVKYAS